MTSPSRPPDPEHGWYQVSLWCSDWRTAEQTALSRLGPSLNHSEDTGLVDGWWFVRKESCWRVRYRSVEGQDTAAQAAVSGLLQELKTEGDIESWAVTLYEPEVCAFGGLEGMDVAHTLFCLDSRYVLDHLGHAGDRHRSEMAFLLACSLLRGAAQDLYEQGDVFARVAAHRRAQRPPTTTEVVGVTRLLSARTTRMGWVAAWPDALAKAGEQLATLAHTGRLTRGLRAVLAHHILFQWNRAGIPGSRQALLAEAAAEAAFNPDRHIANSPSRQGEHD